MRATDPAAELSGALPSISVIINTCDRRSELRTLLLALERQSYRDFEVVVVLGPTHDDSLEMLESEFADRICLVRCPVFNLSASRNLGLTNAAGQVVAFIDDDAVPSRNWLRDIARAYADTEVAGAGGRTHLVNPGQGQVQFLNGLVTVLAEQVDVLPDSTPRPAFVASDHFVFKRFHGTNMSYRRRALLDINGFDENFEYLFDDADLGVRFGLACHKLVQLPGAVVYHAPTSGRNRGKHPYDLNWYCWLRSIVYFALKNGGPTIGYRKALGHCVRTTSHFFAQVQEAADSNSMPAELHVKARKMLAKGAVVGVLQGLLRRRRFPPRIADVDRELIEFCPRPPATVQPNDVRRQTKIRRNDSVHGIPLRICLLSAGYPPASTHGVARSTATLARGLVELGHQVHIVTAGRRLHVTIEEGVHIHEVNGGEDPRYSDFSTRGYSNLGFWLNHSHAVNKAVESLQQEEDIQLVDSPLWGLEGLVTGVAGSIPIAVRVVTSMKQISDIHGRITPENSLLGELEGQFLSMANLIISNSEATTRALSDVYGLDPEHLTIGQATYGMVPAPEAVARPLSDQQPVTPQILFVGRLEKRKGVLELFDAIPKVLREFPSARFMLAGSDNSREDGFYEEHGSDYRSYFRRRFPADAASVDFLGFVDDNRLEALYRACDLFVGPSLYESFGLIYLEAMNWARPVIACAAGGPEDIIVDNETGLLVPPGDTAALAESITKMLASATMRREMGIAGRQRLLNQYTHLAMAQSFAGLYTEMLSRHNPEKS